jgi:vacuolar-type H+-ATPase subunit C/Vma6
VNDAAVTEYVELCEQIAAQSLFSEGDEQKLYDRLDRLWYREMSAVERSEAQQRLRMKAQAWASVHRTKDAS